MPDYSPTERELLVGLIDMVMSLSERLFPEDFVKLRLPLSNPEHTELNWMFPHMTRWIPRKEMDELLAHSDQDSAT